MEIDDGALSKVNTDRAKELGKKTYRIHKWLSIPMIKVDVSIMGTWELLC